MPTALSAVSRPHPVGLLSRLVLMIFQLAAVAYAVLGLFLVLRALVGGMLAVFGDARLFASGATLAISAFLGLGVVLIEVLIARAMLRRPSAGGARLMLVLAFTFFMPAAFPPAGRVLSPAMQQWASQVAMPRALTDCYLLAATTLSLALSIGWADLIVYFLQRRAVFGHAASQQAESGATPTAMRIGFALLSGLVLAAFRAWPELRPSAPYPAVIALVAFTIFSMVMSAFAVGVVRRGGWRRGAVRNPFVDSPYADWRKAVIDVRRAVGDRRRFRYAVFSLLALLTVAGVVAGAIWIFTGKTMRFVLGSWIGVSLPDAWSDRLYDHPLVLWVGVSLAMLGVIALVGRWLLRGGASGLAALCVSSAALLAGVGFVGRWSWIELPRELQQDRDEKLAFVAAAVFILLVLVVAQVRGIRALNRLSRLRRALPPVDGRVLLRRPRGRRRPSLYASGRVVAVSACTGASGLAALLGLIYAIPLGFFTTTLGAPFNPAFWPARRLWRLARRYGSPSARTVRRVDGRRPLLLLRSFKDDGLPMQPSWMFGDIFAAGDLTFEECVTDRLWRFGPVLAIGQPGEPIPRAGAAREYVAHDAWQSRVTDLAHEAGLICLIVGRTPGVAWEFIRLQRLRLLAKAVIVLPPTDEREAAQRWRQFCGALPDEEEDFDAVRRLDVRNALLVCFPKGEAGPPLPFLSDRRTQPGYEAALDLAGAMLCPRNRAAGATQSAVERALADSTAAPTRPMPKYVPPPAEERERIPSLGRRGSLAVITAAAGIAAAAAIVLPLRLEPSDVAPNAPDDRPPAQTREEMSQTAGNFELAGTHSIPA